MAERLRNQVFELAIDLRLEFPRFFRHFEYVRLDVITSSGVQPKSTSHKCQTDGLPPWTGMGKSAA